tara:strand:- start:85115 stop:88981 length:3867 start_codon:yes stop_codon:yes gene_type:complete
VFNRIHISLFLFLFIGVGEAADCWLETSNSTDSNYTIGDTVALSIVMDTNGDTLRAHEYFLTFDPAIFMPVMVDSVPFLPINFGQGWFKWANDTHGDVWGESDMLNGISGFQLDYSYLTISESYISGIGIVASFSLVVVNIPNNELQSTDIVFDDDDSNSRVTRYNNKSNEMHTFNSAQGITIFIEGYSIYPVIPDTLLLPGESFIIDLDDHFESNEFSFADAVWSSEIIQPLDGANIVIDELTNILTLTTTVGCNGILAASVSLNIPGQTLVFSQDWTLVINHPIRFVDPFPTIFFPEDTDHFVHYDSLFIDEDNTPEEIAVWDTLVTLNTPTYTNYDDNDTIWFSAEPDWHGIANTRFFVQEPLGRLIENLLVIIVLNVNDPPVLDFSGVSSDSTLGDTLILYHGTSDTVDLREFVYDVDDNEFSWSFEENSYLEVDILANDILRIFLPFTPLVDTQLVVNVDDGDTTVTRPINIKIRSIPPQILLTEPLLVHADSSYSIDLETAVSDPDTPQDSLTWEFSFLNPEGAPDTNVEFDYNLESNMLTINSIHSQNSEGTIILTVRENFDFGNVVTVELPILYFSSNAPQVLTPDMIFTYPDTLIAALDLDTLVFDYNDPPNLIIWSLSGISELEDTYIDSVDHILYIQTGTDFFGKDTLTLAATNSLMLSDTIEIIVNVIPYNPYPQISILPDTTVYWHSASTYLFDLDDFVLDESTSDQDIDWTVAYDTDSIDVSINDANQVLITSSDLTGTVSIIFTAENDVGYSSSDTVNVLIVQDEPPNWEQLLNIEMSRLIPNDTLSYQLSDRCEDDLTSSNNLIFGVETDTTILKIVLDSQTNVMLELQDTSIVDTTTSLTFYAEDEHFNISTSNTVTLTIINGFAPEWGSLPLITFGNDTTYMSECLEEWCEDPDTPDSLLTFIVESTSQDLYAEVIDGPGCSSLWLVPLSEIQGTYFLILRVEDIQGNISSKLVTVTISDQVLPSADLSYFITPGLNRRLHYILTSDGSVQDFTNSFFLDDSLLGSLSFSLIDQQPELQLWNAPYNFLESGLYDLIVYLTDNSNNTMIDTLSLSVSLPSSEGGRLISSSAKLILQYPNAEYSENQIFILKENIDMSEAFFETEQTLYSIESNISADIAFVATFTGETDGSDYYSFYRVFEGQGILVPTFIDKDGKFQASVALNSHFYIGRSSNPAQSVALPQDNIYCYPNPFNSVISIMFFMPVVDEVKISVYNILGERVFSYDHEAVPGLITLNWDGRDNNGQNLPTGLYFYHLSAGSKQMTSKITILK